MLAEEGPDTLVGTEETASRVDNGGYGGRMNTLIKVELTRYEYSKRYF